jgi:APA family basic amino acid/polyamine antiporter
MQNGNAQAQHGQMGLWMTSSLVVGTIIGAGIFVLPVSLTPLGRNAVVGWMISGAGAVFVAITLGRLSHLGDDGIQANIERKLGPTLAFLAAWSFWVSNWVSQAVTALAGASALSWIDPRLSRPSFVLPVAILSVVVFTAINAAGVRASGGATSITVLIKLLPLVAVILLLGMHAVHHQPLEPFAPSPWNAGDLSTAAALTFFALTGFEGATTLVGKVRNPSRTIPLALFGGTLSVAVLYLLSSTGVQLLLPAQLVVSSPSPFADTLATQWGYGPAVFATVAIAIASFGCLNSLILATGELGYAMGLRGDLPRIMTRTRGVNTPVASQVVGGVLTVVLILANSNHAGASIFTFFILLATSALLVVYFAGALAAWKVGLSPAGRMGTIVAFVFILFATYGSGLQADLWCLVLLVAGLVVRAIMRRITPTASATASSKTTVPSTCRY